MITLIVLLSVAGYLAVIGATIALCGRLHGKYRHICRELIGRDIYSHRSKEWSRADTLAGAMEWIAGCSILWPVELGLGLAAMTIGGLGWVLIFGLRRLFMNQSKHAIDVAKRQKQLAKEST